MTTYEHLCKACDYEWEQVYGMTVDPPTLCPKCKVDGKVKRLISGGSGKGIVILRGQDLKDHCKSEGRRIAREAMTNENLRANLIGEEKYHAQLTETSQITDELVKIGQDAPTKKQQSKKGVIRRVDQK